MNDDFERAIEREREIEMEKKKGKEKKKTAKVGKKSGRSGWKENSVLEISCILSFRIKKGKSGFFLKKRASYSFFQGKREERKEE